MEDKREDMITYFTNLFNDNMIAIIITDKYHDEIIQKCKEISNYIGETILLESLLDVYFHDNFTSLYCKPFILNDVKELRNRINSEFIYLFDDNIKDTNLYKYFHNSVFCDLNILTIVKKLIQ